MEQPNTLAINTQILSNLPDTLVANSSLAERAVAKVTADIAQIKTIDLTTVDAQTMEVHDATLAGLQGKLKESYTIMNERRSPFTRLFTDITSRFTAEEKKIAEIGNEVKAIRDGWQKEKARRNAIAQADQQKELERKQALIDARTYFARCIIDKFTSHAVEAIKRMHSKFYAQDEKSLDAYTAALSKWTPALDSNTWNLFLEGIINPKPQLLTKEQCDDLLREVQDEQRPKLSAEWAESMTRERDALVELSPSRKMELQRIANDATAAAEAQVRIEQEQRDREEQARKEAEDKAQALTAAADVDKMNSAFDTAAQSAPVVGIAKGTVVKKKYVPKSHKAHVAIVQWWVSNCMAKMTLDELQTKLSFMRTAADKALNDGVVIEADGLEVIEDYSTRASRKTA